MKKIKEMLLSSDKELKELALIILEREHKELYETLFTNNGAEEMQRIAHLNGFPRLPGLKKEYYVINRKEFIDDRYRQYFLKIVFENILKDGE